MTTQQAKLAQMQTQLATGKQIVQPSDDPDKAGLIQRLNTAYDSARKSTRGRLTLCRTD